jgi:penicillin-insensitive murein endopeptidase
MKYLITIFFLVGILGSCSHQLPDFTTQLSNRAPTLGKAEAIGEYSLGCLNGAETFNGSEKGILLSQKKRGRYWGHPDLIKLLTDAGNEFFKQNKSLMIGDLSLSRGGPMIMGHNSHQTGLDVDIWFKILSNQNLAEMTFRNLEIEEMAPIQKLNLDQFNLVKYFLQDERVERIFINPSFKKDLCENSEFLKLKIEEQQKLRPWWGHNDHIHVRLKCPKDGTKCISQSTVPKGNGCGEELNWWFTEEAKASDVDLDFEELKQNYLKKIEKLPSECSSYLEIF